MGIFKQSSVCSVMTVGWVLMRAVCATYILVEFTDIA